MSEPFIAEIKIFAGSFAPRGWAFCDGQLLPISQNTALFSLIGTTYGGDGRTTFALPDLRSRVPVHVGTGVGLSTYNWGQRGGIENVTLTEAQMPSHTHVMQSTGKMIAESRNGSADDPTGNMLAAGSNIFRPNTPVDDVEMDPAMLEVTTTAGFAGGSQSHTNMQPFLAMYFIIALVGIYPSRS
ncbi:phage tail protein [uncultured Tateyamaria sp.]|uniref:phage tail protein n=1 Tax=uncultured Tateyamaria sp. TaxID=455651 RepID=UPI0026261D58|nr:tail fiber protein [uncultured Tateyamaria sp.]